MYILQKNMKAIALLLFSSTLLLMSGCSKNDAGTTYGIWDAVAVWNHIEWCDVTQASNLHMGFSISIKANGDYSSSGYGINESGIYVVDGNNLLLTSEGGNRYGMKVDGANAHI